MNKAELIEAITDRLGDKRAARRAVEVVVDTITRAVAKGEKVAISGFGAFEKLERPARVGRNPATGEKVRVKKTSVPKFRPGRQFKAVVSGAVKLPRLAANTARSAAGSRRRAIAAKPPAAASQSAAAPAAPAKRAPTKTAATKSAPTKTAATRKTADTKAGKTAATKTAAAKKTTTRTRNA